MSTAPVVNSLDSPSTFTWGDLFDVNRRTAANGISLSDKDQRGIIQRVSSYAWNAALWPFTLQTTTLGQIPCQNMVQDYPQPPNCFRLTRAWLDVPTAILPIDPNDPFNTVPPYDDPSYAAYLAAQASSNYVASLSAGSGTPRAYQYPLDIVKRIDENLIPISYAGIKSCCQLPNSGLIRLWSATSVPDSQPFSLELEFQTNAPKITDLSSHPWFPDSHVSIAEEGIIYWLYRIVGDPRAGTSTLLPDNSIERTGQLATWHAAITSAATAERSGAIDSFSPAPDATLSSSSGSWGWGWGA